MAKYFIASVGSVDAFVKNGDNYELAFTSKTLTDSGINTSITKDDIRGGTGAPIQFSFYHDPTVDVTLTDIVFKTEYLEALLGVEFSKAGAHSYYNDTVVATAGSITLTKTPLALNFGACGGELKLVWASEKGKDEWKAYSFDTGSTISNEDFKEGVTYCVRYCVEDPNAIIASVTSTIIPKEYMLIVTAPIFAGDACAASNGKKAGTITYEIPRFRPNGGTDMAFNMSSNQTMALSGSVYAADTSCEAESSNLYNVIVSLDSGEYKITELIVDEDTLKVGTAPKVYGLYGDKVELLDNATQLTFEPALNSGNFEANTYTIKLKADNSVTDQVTVSE